MTTSHPLPPPDDAADGLSRRRFIGSAAVGAVALATTSVSPALITPAAAQGRGRARRPVGDIPGLQPRGAANVRRFPTYGGQWTQLPENPFGGYDFAMGYMAEGVQGADPESPTFPNGQFSNTSGLFEHHTLRGIATPPTAADTGQPLGPVPSGVGGNETPTRSAEFWSRDILGQSNEAIRDDMWSAINWMRRVWALDFDDPAVDGLNVFGDAYQYPGSPDAGNDYSLFAPRVAAVFDEDGQVTGYARFAPTLLAPDTSYTVIFRAGHSNPTYTGGAVINGVESRTTASSPDWPAKVRDGGFWGGIVQAMDVLPDIQSVSRGGERPFTTPTDPAQPLSGTTPPNPAKRGQHGGSTTTNPQGGGPKWGQWWRRVAPIVGLDVDDPALLALTPSIDATTNINTAANMDLVIPGTDVPPGRRPGPAGRSASGPATPTSSGATTTSTSARRTTRRSPSTTSPRCRPTSVPPTGCPRPSSAISAPTPVAPRSSPGPTWTPGPASPSSTRRARSPASPTCPTPSSTGR